MESYSTASFLKKKDARNMKLGNNNTSLLKVIFMGNMLDGDV